MSKLFDNISIEEVSKDLNEKIDVLDQIDMEEAYLDVTLIASDLNNFINVVASTEEALNNLNDIISIENNILESNEVITKEHIDLSIKNTEDVYSLVGSKFDSVKIISNEDFRDALVTSMEAKIASGKWWLDILTEVYDKIVLYVKKLYIKALVYFTNVKKSAVSILSKLNANEDKVGTSIAISDKLEDKIINRFGAMIYGFSGTNINIEFFKKLFKDLEDTTVFDAHKYAVQHIISKLQLLGNKYQDAINLPISEEVREAVYKAYEAEKDNIIRPFRYNGLNYKSLTVEKFNLDKSDRTMKDFILRVAGTSIKVITTEVQPKQLKGQIKNVNFKDLLGMVEIVIDKSDRLKTFQSDMQTKADEIYQAISEIKMGNNEKQQQQAMFIFPATNYARTILTTVVVDKTLGFIMGMKDGLSLVSMLATECIANGKGPGIDPNQLKLENKK